jgi:hypothetical protein
VCAVEQNTVKKVKYENKKSFFRAPRPRSAESGSMLFQAIRSFFPIVAPENEWKFSFLPDERRENIFRLDLEGFKLNLVPLFHRYRGRVAWNFVCQINSPLLAFFF